MANNGMINPMMQQSMQSYLLGPDILQKQYQLQQNQRYADMLMGQAQEPLNGQMVGDHYVGASPVQGLANMLKAYTSRKMMDDMPSQQYQLAGMQNQRVNDMFGVGGGNAPASQAAQMALGGGAMQGSVGPTNANAARMDGVQSGTAPAMPIPPGMSNQVAAQLYAISPEKFAEALVSYGKPTERMQNESNYGIGRDAGRDLYLQEARAKGAIDGGKWIQGQNGLEFVPDMKNGIYGGMKNGVPQVFPIPGYAGANATIEGAKADAVSRAQAGNKVTTVATGPNQTKQLVTEAQAIDAATGGKPMPVEPDSKTQNAGDIETYIDQANKLLGNASSGFFSKFGTAATDTVGISADKSKADAQLKVVSGNLVLKMPRMEGPQSDADRKLYQSMAADVANPDIPIASRQAALKTLQELNNKYLPQSQQSQPKAPVPDSNGIYKPKTKAEYDALPSGSRAYNSKGQIVVKP